MKSIGKYEVLDEIGSSVTGTTYRARDNFQKREIALKVLHPLVKADVAAQDQYCREMLLYSELTHRHLVKVVDLGEIEGRIYIASKLLQGDDLARYADRNRELPLASKLAILAQACEGQRLRTREASRTGRSNRATSSSTRAATSRFSTSASPSGSP